MMDDPDHHLSSGPLRIAADARRLTAVRESSPRRQGEVVAAAQENFEGTYGAPRVQIRALRLKHTNGVAQL